MGTRAVMLASAGRRRSSVINLHEFAWDMGEGVDEPETEVHTRSVEGGLRV